MAGSLHGVCAPVGRYVAAAATRQADFWRDRFVNGIISLGEVG
jgi:hypothetical protein